MEIFIWLDHSAAWIYEAGQEKNARKLDSGVETRVRIPGEDAVGTRLGNYRSTNNEAHRHNRYQNQLRSFYKKLAGQLTDYDRISIGGTGTAANEMYNFLSELAAFRDKEVFLQSGKKEMPAGLT